MTNLGTGFQFTDSQLLFDRTPLQRGLALREANVNLLVNGKNRGVNMTSATQNVAKHFSVLLRDSGTGAGAALTVAQVSTFVVLLKKGGLTSYSTITPVITIVGTSGLVDIALTASHLDTLGVAAVNITGPGIIIPNDDLIIDVQVLNVNDGVRAGLTAIPNANAGVSGGLPTIDANLNVAADLKRWLGTAPAALTANGFVQAMLTRWLTDDAGGTPNALTSGKVDTTAPSTASVAAAIMASVLRDGGSDPDSTMLGHLRRMDALFFGEVSGLLGTLVTAMQPGGVTPEFTATQDPVLGTRVEVDRTTSETP